MEIEIKNGINLKKKISRYNKFKAGTLLYFVQVMKYIRSEVLQLLK